MSEQRLLEDLEREVRAAGSSRSEYVGCGTLEAVYVQGNRTGPLKGASVRFRFNGKSITREKAERLVQAWNAPQRSPGFYWILANDRWEVAEWDGAGWLLINNSGGPYTDAQCCEEVGERAVRPLTFERRAVRAGIA